MTERLDDKHRLEQPNRPAFRRERRREESMTQPNPKR